MFGEEKQVRVFCIRNNKFDERGNYKSEVSDFNQNELDVLNRVINNIS